MTRKVNEGLPDYARIHRVLMVEQPISEALMTGNGRLKRSEVISLYQTDIENEYERKTDTETSGVALNVL
jgi:hypothetical protein